MNQRVMLTKRLLKDSLLSLLESRSIDAISIKELCLSAGINRSTFYAHYDSVRSVLAEIENGIIEDVKKICQSKRYGTHEKLVRVCDHLYKMKSVELILFKNNAGENLSDIFDTMDIELRQVRRIKYSKEEEELILSFFNYGMFNLIKTWLVKDIHKTPEEIADLILNRILNLNI